MNRNRIGPPALSHTFTEAARATMEFWSLRATYSTLKEATPRGDGRPVLVLPGLGANDFSTDSLRGFLSDKGYAVYGWDGGMNTGPDERTLLWLQTRLKEVSARHDGVRVTLIGHSLGGIYSRELARSFPHLVSQVITLGSPFAAGLQQEATAPVVRKAFEMMNGPGHRLLNDAALARLSLQPPPVPTTSIYSCTDGLVSWQACLNPKRTAAENVEVSGSHCGLIHNPLALVVIADRLAQDMRDGAARWHPFERLRYPAFYAFPAQAHHGLEPDCPEEPQQNAPRGRGLFDRKHD